MSPSSLGKKLQKARELVKSGSFAEGLNLYAILVRQFPQSYGEYGSAAAHSGDFELADRMWAEHRRREQKNVRALCWLAGEYRAVGLHIKSRELYTEAANTEPSNLDAQISLAAFLARTGSVEEARPVVSKCLELDPRNEPALYLSAHLDRRENKLAEAEQQLLKLLAADLKLPQVRYSCYSELAHILDKWGQFDEAMTRLEEGKKYGQQPLAGITDWKAGFKQPEAEVRQAKSLPKNILAEWNKTFPPSTRNQIPPVAFLSGSSRSGTTLLERILDAHSAVTACDEPMAFQKIRPRIDITASSIPVQRLNGLRELYIRNLAMVLGAPANGKILLDKNPARTIWLPALLRAFPEMRVLITLRDPRDVILSLYFQDHPNTNYVPMEQLAYYYTLVMDVWLAVREWEGLMYVETRYEDLIADLEKEGGRVAKFLGLEWQENQARFYDHNREKPILSTNYSDVTRPVYKRSLGRWRIYEKKLAPILPILEPYCRKFGYDSYKRVISA